VVVAGCAHFPREPAARTRSIRSGSTSGVRDAQPPRVAATVQSLPKGAKQTTVAGTEYYEYADTYYQVFHSGSKVVYMVVKNPNA
jgi:hypothetical protein